MQDIEILLPRMITREQYIAAISGAAVNEHIKGIDNDIKRFDFDCALIVCGFVDKVLPYILLLEPPGVMTDCTNNGFCATGSGAEKAMSRLLFVDHKREHGVAQIPDPGTRTVRTFTLAPVALAVVLGSGSGFAFDCAGVKLPSSLVICSDLAGCGKSRWIVVSVPLIGYSTFVSH
jgi:hypothetical protein